jgi:twinkle protein
VTDLMIDFEKYAQEPPEASRIRPASAWVEDVIARFYGEEGSRGSVLPWSKTHGRLLLRPHEVSVWAGYNGSGKTMLLNLVMLGVMAQGDKTCIASFEMTPKALMYRMTRQATGLREPSIQAIREFHTWTDGRLWLYDHGNAAKPERVMAVCRYCREELGIEHMVIDSLMKCGIATDDYNAQKAFVDQLCVHARDTGMHVHLVTHGRKGDGEYQRMDKHDVKGASEITDLVDNVFTIWRNKPKEEKTQRGDAEEDTASQPDTVLACVKNRHGEFEGKIALWYHADSFQFVGGQGGRPIDFLSLSRQYAARGAT